MKEICFIDFDQPHSYTVEAVLNLARQPLEVKSQGQTLVWIDSVNRIRFANLSYFANLERIPLVPLDEFVDILHEARQGANTQPEAGDARQTESQEGMPDVQGRFNLGAQPVDTEITFRSDVQMLSSELLDWWDSRDERTNDPSYDDTLEQEQLPF